MASNQGSPATNIRECPVCLDDMTKKSPKLLTCKHSYCTPCLSGLAEANGMYGLKIKCPQCRHNTVVRSGMLSDLPDNFLLRELKAALDEQLKYLYCFYCNKLDKKTKADHHCAVCRRYLCSDCLNKHKKNPKFAEHEIVSFVDEEKKIGEVCLKHNETAIYVCRTCSPVRLLCDVCMTLDHACHDPEGLIDYPSALSEMQYELRLELDKIRKFNEELSKVDSEKQMIIQRVHENANAFIIGIQARRDEIISQIQESFDTTPLKLAVREIEHSVEELLEKDNKTITELSAATKDITDTLEFYYAEDRLPGDMEETIITGIGATYMKMALFDLSTFRGDAEGVTPEVPEGVNPHSISTKLNKNKDQNSLYVGDRGNPRMFKEKVPTFVEPKTLKTDFDIGSTVRITTLGPVENYGVIRWIGYYDNPDRPIAGIEMFGERVGTTDGTYMGYKLFDCPPRKARFVYLSHCRPDDRLHISLSDLDSM